MYREGHLSLNYKTLFHDVHDAYAEEPKWIITNWTPVGLKIYGAPPKHNKSTLANSEPCILAGWNCKVLPPWAKLVPDMGGPSVILSGQATSGEINYLYTKCFKLKTAPETIFINEDPWDFKLDNPKRVKNLFSLLDDINARQLVIDPLQSYVSGNLDDALFVEDILYPLRKWAVSNDASVSVVHHLVKDPPNSKLEELMDPARIRGSGNIFGQADAVMMCRLTNRFIGEEMISAIFKRGAPWLRSMYLGVPGYGENWKEWGQEVMNDLDQKVVKLLNSGCAPSSMHKQLHVKESEVLESLQKIERN